MTSAVGNINHESMRGVALATSPSIVSEMRAYDALGPLARRAFDEGPPVKMLAWHVLQQCAANGWNPRSVEIDRHVARCITDGARAVPSVVPQGFSFDRVQNAIDRAGRRAA